MPIPLMILSDAPSARTGLARITRDLATRIATDCPEFRVATLGYGGTGSVKLPFPQYHIHSVNDWHVHELPIAWHDFAGDEKGILLCIWDVTRLAWLVNPPKSLKFADWLKDRPFELWAYPAVDAEGPHGKLPKALQMVLNRFDRVINYSKFASEVTGYPDYLPHGIDMTMFCPKPNAKKKFREYGFQNLKDESFLIGIVATNQPRKDWALGIQTVDILRKRGHDVRLWAHTDGTRGFWNLDQLLQDYDLREVSAVTTDEFPDHQMAELYSACDVTLGIGLGEGFGYPLAESLACGTPVIHGHYAGGAEIVPPILQVWPVTWRYEGAWCWKRPVFSPEQWANVVEEYIDEKKVVKMVNAIDQGYSLYKEFDWDVLWPKWKEWLLKGIK